MWRTTSILIGSVLILLTLGIVMVASTSSYQGELQFGNPNHYLHRQVVWLILGLIACTAMASLDHRYWKKVSVPLAVFTSILLVMCITPGVGVEINGSSRWLRFGPINLQPSELAKLSMIFLMAWWMNRIHHRATEFRRGLLVPMAFLGVMAGLIFLEPDFGTTLLVCVVGMTVMFVGGTRISYLAVAAALGLSAFTIAVMQNPVRMRRITAFLNPEKYAQNEAFQLINAKYAFVVGGGSGVGLGDSLQKRFYLPEAHTDFIFAIIGEELGVAAPLLIVFLFFVIFNCGVRISFRAPEVFSRLVAFGITMMITLQAAINIGVVIGVLPTKGLALPFISFGGSSMVMSLAMVGVLISISRRAGDGRGHYIKDRARRV